MAQKPRSIGRRAFAKINLAMAVAPAEPAGASRAGWHRICTWMHAVDLADSVVVERIDSGPARFDIAWDDGRAVEWAAQSDLVCRAHAALEAWVGSPLPAFIKVRKSIPAGGGLGGGSSDAAAALMAVNELFELGLAAGELAAVAMPISSDAVFFIDDAAMAGGDQPPRAAIVSGFGDEIERLERTTREVTLIVPPAGCSTPEVYGAFDGTTPGPMRDGEVRALAASLTPEALFNDLAGPAEMVNPGLAEIRGNLAAALERPVHVSGSGSTMFVLDAGGLGERIRQAAPGCRIVETRLV